MTLFEWLGESHNPGSIGTIDAKIDHGDRKLHWGLVLFNLLVTLAGIGGIYYAVIHLVLRQFPG